MRTNHRILSLSLICRSQREEAQAAERRERMARLRRDELHGNDEDGDEAAARFDCTCHSVAFGDVYVCHFGPPAALTLRSD